MPYIRRQLFRSISSIEPSRASLTGKTIGSRVSYLGIPLPLGLTRMVYHLPKNSQFPRVGNLSDSSILFTCGAVDANVRDLGNIPTGKARVDLVCIQGCFTQCRACATVAKIYFAIIVDFVFLSMFDVFDVPRKGAWQVNKPQLMQPSNSTFFWLAP